MSIEPGTSYLMVKESHDKTWYILYRYNHAGTREDRAQAARALEKLKIGWEDSDHFPSAKYAIFHFNGRDPL